MLLNSDESILSENNKLLELKGNVKIREFEFVEIADFDQSRPTLFSKREVNDLGESVFSPQPSYEYELIYFKKISPDFFNS